jgi:hypothetical protein
MTNSNRIRHRRSARGTRHKLANKSAGLMLLPSEETRKMHMKSLIFTALLAGAVLMSGNKALAQDPTDGDINLFRKDVRSLKKQIIAANMDLTDNEAEQFWPIYDRYTAELIAITDKKYALLKEYAQNYTTMSSEQAESYIKGRAAVEESIMKLRLKYLASFRKVLSGKATALFFQMDWRLGLIMDLQLASQTPLIEP